MQKPLPNMPESQKPQTPTTPKPSANLPTNKPTTAAGTGIGTSGAVHITE